jgi:hypothetical protein
MPSRCAQELCPPPFILPTMSYSDGNMDFPARTIHRCVESLPKCTARLYCRPPFRNPAICQASSTRSVCLSLSIHSSCSVTYYYMQPEWSFSFTCQRTCKTLRPGTQNWSSRVHKLTLRRPLSTLTQWRLGSRDDLAVCRSDRFSVDVYQSLSLPCIKSVAE